MIYLSVLCIVLLAYIAYLHYAWSKTRRSLKEMIVENDRHTTASNETGDTILKNAAGYCVTTFKNPDTHIGRFDKTKIGIIFSRGNREEAAKGAEKLYKSVIEQIRRLNIDQYNAEMIAVSYTDRKNFNDTADNMLGRVRRHIGNALRSHRYGIRSSDSKD